MIEKFLNLEKEKQDRIVNAAIKEFAQKGYDHASTNNIVKAAGISKGLLFHYFKNKKGLFLFLFDHCVKLITKEYYQKTDLTEADFFKRIRQAVQIKMNLIAQFPEIFKFIEAAYLEDSAEVRTELEERIEALIGDNIAKVYEGIDTSRFRDDMDLQKILKIITWTFEQLSKEITLKAKLSPSPARKIDYDAAVREANEYFEILIKCFYK